MSDTETSGIIFRIPDDVTDLRAAQLQAPDGQEVVGLVIPGLIRSVNLDPFPFRNIRTLVLEEGVERIGEIAFATCAYLESVRFPASLRRIDGAAFSETGLRCVVLPEGLQHLGHEAFNGCRQLRFIQLPSSLRFLPAFVFADSGLTECDLPEGIEEIGEYAFAYCEALERITLPGTIRTISECAFSYSGLRELVLPEGLTELNESAFCLCPHLREVRLPASLSFFRRCFSSLKGAKCWYPGLRQLHLVFSGVPSLIMTGCLDRVQRVTLLCNADRDAVLSLVGYLGLPGDCELVADRIPLRGLQLSIQMRIFRTWDKRLRRGEPIPEEARANLLDGAKSRRRTLWRAGILRQFLLEEGLLSLQNVQTFLEEAQQEGDSELVAQLLEYEHRHFSPEEVERQEWAKIQRVLKDLEAPVESHGPPGRSETGKRSVKHARRRNRQDPLPGSGQRFGSERYRASGIRKAKGDGLGHSGSRANRHRKSLPLPEHSQPDPGGRR